LAEISRQRKAKNIIMSEGGINVIDATQIEAGQLRAVDDKDGKPAKDSEAGWRVKNNSRGNSHIWFSHSYRCRCRDLYLSKA